MSTEPTVTTVAVPRGLLWRSLRFYWRTHLSVLLGVAAAGAILTGALAVGDSVRYTLQQLARARLGRIAWALSTPEHGFRARLADELARELRAAVAPALLLRGSAARPDGAARANDVQVLGVEARFWQLGNARDLLRDAAADEVAVSARLAARLGLRAGDSLIVRVEPPALIARDAPLSGRSDASVAFRVRVRAVAEAGDFGRFGLRADQVPPLTVFLPLPALQAQLKREGQANLLLTDAPSGADAALRKCWTLADAGLELRALPGQRALELRTERVFLDPAVVPAALGLNSNAVGVLTYFVNEIRCGDSSTPYSFVAATFAPLAVAAGLRDDEIAINDWLAEDLGAKVGDLVNLRYYVLGARRELKEQTASLRVGAVIPCVTDASWMPAYPGLADVANCRAWEPGIPIDLDRIRPKDEAYWNQHRGTPKAFVTLATGQKLWANRFGSLTAVRFPGGSGDPAAWAQALKARLDPAALGLFFAPAREQARQASGQGQDFGMLFAGFSFFLMAAALLLTALLFAFHIEQRQAEAGLLRAVGFRPAQVRWLLWREGLVVAALGALLGVGAGALYTRLTLLGLATVWREAVGATIFRYHPAAGTLLGGAGLTLLAAGAAMALVQRGQGRRPPAELLARGAEWEDLRPVGQYTGWAVGGCGFLGATALLVSGGGHGPEAAERFFGAGACLLVAGLGACHGLLAQLARATRGADSLAAVGLRNAARRPGRSLAVIGALASGIFLLLAVSVFQRDPRQDAGDRRAGTGGFAAVAQTALPVYDDLNSAAGRDVFGLSAADLQGVSFVPFRVRGGDDASCLNLNRAQQPRLLGVSAAELERRGAFSFVNPGGGWGALDAAAADGAVPAIGDEPTITWALGKKLGDLVPYTDERGRTFQLRIAGVLAGSVLQGGLLISEQAFVARFPSAAGYRFFLVDTPEGRLATVMAALSRGLQDRGLDVVPAWQRLGEFLAVENTYLSIFQALGGLGLGLGSLGLGIVVLRNALERRHELALLQAVGFSRGRLQVLLLGEHGLLILLGLAAGLGAALLAVLPALRAPGAALPWGRLLSFVLGLALGGFLWTWLAARAALRGPLLPALRRE